MDEATAPTSWDPRAAYQVRAQGAERWARLATELAHCPDLVPRLLAEHRDDGDGRCSGCRRPGYGSPGAEQHPCVLRSLAELAQRLVLDHNR